ncbi:hypothetical protein [Hydrangea phyllody phytoplasma]|uniref:hypothetical protein n=1 Tax=Hydrangea phyllody phytoplasma TaxID=238673 RepID=UPI0030D7B9BD
MRICIFVYFFIYFVKFLKLSNIAIDYTRVGYLRAAPLQTVQASFQAYGFP